MGDLSGGLGGDDTSTTLGNIKIEPPPKPVDRKPRGVVIQPLLVKPERRVRYKLKRAIKNSGYDFNARNLYMHYNYPHSPFQFYQPNDKYSEMPMNVINYKGDPVRVDETQAVKKLKAKVKDETRNYMVDQNLVEQLKVKLVQVQDSMKSLRNEILRGEVNLNAKIDLLKGSKFTIQLNF